MTEVQDQEVEQVNEAPEPEDRLRTFTVHVEMNEATGYAVMTREVDGNVSTFVISSDDPADIPNEEEPLTAPQKATRIAILVNDSLGIAALMHLVSSSPKAEEGQE